MILLYKGPPHSELTTPPERAYDHPEQHTKTEVFDVPSTYSRHIPYMEIYGLWKHRRFSPMLTLFSAPPIFFLSFSFFHCSEQPQGLYHAHTERDMKEENAQNFFLCVNRGPNSMHVQWKMLPSINSLV